MVQAAPGKEEPVDPNADYTKESELKALVSQHTLMPNHAIQMEIMTSLSCQDFFKNYMSDEAE